jgi:hypothetical protein
MCSNHGGQGVERCDIEGVAIAEGLGVSGIEGQII